MSPTMARGRSGGRFVLVTWAGSRLILLIVAAVVTGQTGRDFGQIFANWDVQHYEAIAAHGYADKLNMAFLPGLPLLLRGVANLGVPMTLAGVLLGEIGALLAAWALYRIAGAPAACVWLIAPMSVFTTVGYSEALFLAAGLWAWECARRRHWAGAAILATLACAMRVSGVFLLVGLGLVALFGDGPGMPLPAWGRRVRQALWLLVPVLVLGGFVVYLHELTGSWTAWLGAQQQGWQRGFTTPWQSLRNTLFAVQESAWPTEPTRAWIFRFEIASVAIGYVTALGCLIARQWARAGYVLTSVLALSCAGWFMSVNRGVLLWFPLFVALGAMASWRPRSRAALVVWRVLVVMVVLVDLVVMCWWASLFYRGMWAS